VNAAVATAAGAGAGGVLIAGLWLWQRHGVTVWLEMGLAWCL
jgi:hypothetical protein